MIFSKYPYDNWTDAAKKSFALANQFAQNHNSEFIGTEHLLAGICLNGNNSIFEMVSIKSWEVLQKVVEKLCKNNDVVTMGRLPLTPAANRIIEIAESNWKNSTRIAIGIDDILFAMTIFPDCIAYEILSFFGINQSLIMAHCSEKSTPMEKSGVDVGERFLYDVNITVSMPVLASTRKESWKIAIESIRSELDNSFISSKLIRDLKQLKPEWTRRVPYGAEDITCAEIVKAIEDDPNQMKLWS